jgi:hypothetical protein
MEFTQSDNPKIDCYDCVILGCPYFGPDEDAQEDRPIPGQCPRKITTNFMNGKTADQRNIEMVQYFAKKGIVDKLPEGMLEKYGDVSVR